MTAGTAGNLVGPLLGGALSSFFGNLLGGAWGYRIPFFITGVLMFIVFLGTTFLVHEDFTPISREKMKANGRNHEEFASFETDYYHVYHYNDRSIFHYVYRSDCFTLC